MRLVALAMALQLVTATPSLVIETFPAGMRDAVSQVAAAYATRTDNASVLYQVAALHAKAGHRDEAMAALRRMVALRAGLQPRPRDGFDRLLADPEFQRLAAEVRSANPPVLAAREEVRLAEGDLVPEGIAWSATTGRMYLGSLKRKIVAVGRDGSVADFVPSKAHGLGVVLGLRVDDARGELWAISGSIAPKTADMVVGVFRFRLRDGALVHAYPIEGSETDLLNDLDLAPDGAVYVTASNTGALWRIDPATGSVREWLAKGTLPDPNGIAITADGAYAFVAGWHGITRVDLRARSTRELSSPTHIAAGCIDGLYRLGPRDLVGVQNCVHETGRILRLRLSEDLARIESAVVLESYNPLFDGITTAAVAGDSLLFVANTQFRRMGADGEVSGAFDPIHILALPLVR